MHATHRARLMVVGVLLWAGGVTAAGSASALIEAVRKGDATAVRLLLQQGVDVNAPSADGTTALHWAVHRNDGKTVDDLLRVGAKANATNRYAVAPLLLACENGNAAIVERLLAAGAAPSTAWRGGETALLTAARSGSARAVTALLARGADVNHRETTRGQTALMWAAAEGQVDVIRTLVAHGADLSARASGPRPRTGGDTTSNVKGIVLRVAGAKRLDALTPLLFAVRRGQIGAVQALLEFGAPVNDIAPDGRTALALAITNAHYELAALLLAKGADPNISIDGWSPLHQVVATSNPSTHLLPGAAVTGALPALALAERLIAQRADVNVVVTKAIDDESSGRSTVGATPLFIAAARLDAMMIRFLLSNGANQEIAASDGTTPVMAAAGVFEDNRPDDADPRPRLAAVTVLMERGGDVNVVNNKGETALHGAARRGATEVAQLLIEHGARLDQKTKKLGLTPLAIAEGKECALGCRDGLTGVVRPELAKVLRQAMQERGIPIEDIKPVNGGNRVVE